VRRAGWIVVVAAALAAMLYVWHFVGLTFTARDLVIAFRRSVS